MRHVRRHYYYDRSIGVFTMDEQWKTISTSPESSENSNEREKKLNNSNSLII